MRLVPIESVVEGTYLAKTLFDDNGRILLREGVQLTNPLIMKIKDIKIYSIYILDEYSVKEIEDVIKPELRQKSVKVIKDTFYSLSKFSANQSNQPNKNNAMIKERDNYFSAISQIAAELIDELICKKNVMINLVDIKSMDNYTYQHCVNVAVLSLILGIELKFNKFELYDLCIGALVHDIGKVFIPKEIITKEGPLTTDEFNKIKEHSLKGYDYLKKSPEVTAPARIIALYHHERFDGKGYPEKRKGEDIHKYARIVAIADVYDALTSDRPYRRALSPNDALEYIMANSGAQFDYEMVKTFSKIIVPYPEGSLVYLSNGDYAVIEEIRNNYPLRPKIRIVKTERNIPLQTIIDLTSSLDIVITKLVYSV